MISLYIVYTDSKVLLKCFHGNWLFHDWNVVLQLGITAKSRSAVFFYVSFPSHDYSNNSVEGGTTNEGRVLSLLFLLHKKITEIVLLVL